MEDIKLYARKACNSKHIQHIQVHISQSRQWISANPKNTLYGALSVLALLWLSAKVVERLRKKTTPSRPGTPDLEKEKPLSFGRGENGNGSGMRSKFVMEKPGEWKPSPFKRPAATPYPNWSHETTLPLAYRPFRPKYYVTMGLRSMPWDSWIELDNEYFKFHDLKAERIASRGDKCCRTAPEAFDGAVELLEEFCSYLPERYPSLYEKTGKGMRNIVTGEDFDILARPLKEDPMAMAARMVQDDLALMFEGEDGQYYLLAGAILLAGFWRLEDKFRMPLSEIHTSGDVPLYKEKLEKGMMNFFRRLKPEAPMCRNNYFIQVDNGLAWSHSIGAEDSPDVSWNTAEKNKAIEQHHFRSERQSLRRLPRSGAVLFTIRTYFAPIPSIVNEPYVPGRLASAVRSWNDDVAKYRGRARYGDVLLEYLDDKHEAQIAEGTVRREEFDENKGSYGDDVKAYPY